DPEVLAASGVPGCRSVPAGAVEPQHIACPLYHPKRILDIADGCCREVTGDEAQLVAVHVSNAGQHSLVEEGLGQWTVRVGGEVGDGGSRGPVVTEEVRPEMGDHLHVALPLQHLQHPEIDACGLKIGGFQNDSYPITGAARLIDGVDLPAALHLQMRMDAGLADADEQVLTAADDF